MSGKGCVTAHLVDKFIVRMAQRVTVRMVRRGLIHQTSHRSTDVPSSTEVYRSPRQHSTGIVTSYLTILILKPSKVI